MATTFSDDTGIKNIGTGLESGTWGASTNQNFERVSDMLGRSVSLDITSMPTGSTSTTAAGVPGLEVEWVILGASNSNGDSSEAGSEGRSAAVVFHDTVDPLASSKTPIINVRGVSASAYCNRMFIAYNNLGNGNSLILAGGSSGDFTLKNGAFALVATKTSDSGGWLLGVNNLLEKIQVNDIILAAATGEIEFLGNGTITFVGTGTITLKSAEANALLVTDGTDTLLTVDTVAGEVEIGGAVSKDLRVFGDVILSDQASDIVLKDVTVAALEIADESGNKYMNVLTHGTAGTRRLNSGVTFTSPDIVVTGTDGYINMDATVGTTGYGFRNNSGVMELKNSGGSWAEPFSSGTASGGGAYFQTSEISFSNSSTASVVHALGAVPRIISATLKCVRPEGDIGYAQNDEILLTDINNAGGTERGMQIYCSSTVVGYSVGTTITALHRTSFTAQGINVGRWVLIIRAWG